MAAPTAGAGRPAGSRGAGSRREEGRGAGSRAGTGPAASCQAADGTAAPEQPASRATFKQSSQQACYLGLQLPWHSVRGKWSHGRSFSNVAALNHTMLMGASGAGRGVMRCAHPRRRHPWRGHAWRPEEWRGGPGPRRAALRVEGRGAHAGWARRSWRAACRACPASDVCIHLLSL